jgi:hypothetical protein
MKNKLLSLGIPALCLALVLIFGMTVIGCDGLLKALEDDNPETQDYIDSQGKVITLKRLTGSTYDNWGYTYEIPSSITGGQITTGDVYTFTYVFKSDVTIKGGLFCGLIDRSSAANTWGNLSPNNTNITYNGTGIIPANTTVSGTIIFSVDNTASSTEALANSLEFMVSPASNAASAPTFTFTTFSISLVKKGNTPSYIMQGNTVTLSERATGESFDVWQGYYEIPSSITGGKITTGDVYTLTYAFKSNVAITGNGALWTCLVDHSENWQTLSDYNHNFNEIPANTTVSGTITLIATKTASSTSPGTNRLQFGVDVKKPGATWGVASEPTFTFSTFSLVKKENPHIMQGNAVTLSEKGTSGGNDFWQGYYEIPSSVTGGKITKGDVYTLTYAFKSDVDIGLWANLLDNSKEAGYWKELSSFYHFNNYSEIPANTTVSGTVTFTVTETAYSTSANANRLVFQCNAGTSGATSAPTPTLTFTLFSLVKTGNANTQDNVVITLPRATGDTYDNWDYRYEVPSSVTGGKITTGDVYIFTYSFKSNVAINDGLYIGLLDGSEAANWYKQLSNHYSISYNGSSIPANTTVSDTLVFYVNETATSAEAISNSLMFMVTPASNAASAPTLTFTTFSLSKQ